MHLLRVSPCGPTRPLLALVALVTATAYLAAPVAGSDLRMSPVVAAVRGAAPSVVNIQGQKSIADTAPDGHMTGTREVNGKRLIFQSTRQL